MNYSKWFPKLILILAFQIILLNIFIATMFLNREKTDAYNYYLNNIEKKLIDKNIDSFLSNFLSKTIYIKDCPKIFIISSE